jgi:hypothetical protein
MLVSECSWPGGNSALQKNSPTLKPIAAMKPTTTSSRQPRLSGRCRPGGEGGAGADQNAERLADEDRQRESPRPWLQ